LLFIAAVFLFFVTGLVGRAWCGYFCFQTLWSDLFIKIEHMIQGERPARVKLKNQPWNVEKILKVGGSHFLMMLFAWWTAMTFACYFSYAPEFVVNFMTGKAPFGGYYAVVILASLTYLAGGVAREQICLYFCPYARFQGVMYEPDTLVVSYDAKRGEGEKGRHIPIHGIKTHEERKASGYGDCIDCGFCVQVCPTGVDIRKGLQYQCISCGLCIDACNNIMSSMGYPKGLVRYDTQRNLVSENPHQPQIMWKRFKVLGYAVALSLMTSLLFYNVSQRSDIEVNVQQIRQPLFINMSDGSIRNRYMIHIVNKNEADRSYTITTQGIPLDALNLGGISEIHVRAGKALSVNAKVTLPHELAEKTHGFDFVITENTTHEKTVEHASFNTPTENEH
jgi:cytochrome c oxidase accessory protein FixG